MFRLHDDSFPFVRPFAIDREQPDYQCPQNRHRDHGLALLHPQNNLSTRVTGLTELVRTARFRERQNAIDHGFSPFSVHLVARGGAPSWGAS